MWFAKQALRINNMLGIATFNHCSIHCFELLRLKLSTRICIIYIVYILFVSILDAYAFILYQKSIHIICFPSTMFFCRSTYIAPLGVNYMIPIHLLMLLKTTSTLTKAIARIFAYIKDTNIQPSNSSPHSQQRSSDWFGATADPLLCKILRIEKRLHTLVIKKLVLFLPIPDTEKSISSPSSRPFNFFVEFSCVKQNFICWTGNKQTANPSRHVLNFFTVSSQLNQHWDVVQAVFSNIILEFLLYKYMPA